MSKSILMKNKKMLSFLFFLLILLSCFQNIKLYQIGASALKPFHVYSLIFIFIMIVCKRCVFPNKTLLLFLVYSTIVSLINIPKWGFGAVCFNYIFGAYLLVIFGSLGCALTMDDWLKIFIRVAMIMLIAIYVKIIINFNEIVGFFKNSWAGHPAIETFFGGGVNIEATWIAVFGFAFQKSKLKIPYVLLSLLMSTLYSSRTGIIVNVLCILWMFAPYIKNNIFGFIIAGTLFFVILLVLYNMGLFDIVINRFTHIGSEAGSIGRLRMWKYAFKTIYTYPFGCGLGNNIDALRSVSGLSYTNGNMHNLYMQNFVDLGWFGGCFYIIIVVGFIIKETKNLFKNPFVAMLFAYIICSMLQFGGSEAITVCVLGVYLSLKTENNTSFVTINENKNYSTI